MLPETSVIELRHGPSGVLHISLAREHLYNAVNSVMLAELIAVFTALQSMEEIRVVVLRGKGGHFSAGGDLSEFLTAVDAGDDDSDRRMVEVIRDSGRLLTLIDRTPRIVIAVLEGTVLGTGLGIACVSDMVIVHSDAELSLPEVMIGFPPSQIAPFLLRRIGPSGTRMLALTGYRFDGREAHRLGLAHMMTEDRPLLEQMLLDAVQQALLCGPGAVKATKKLLHDLGPPDIERYLDAAAETFVRDMRKGEGVEGLNAFVSKRVPSWRVCDEAQVEGRHNG